METSEDGSEMSQEDSMRIGQWFRSKSLPRSEKHREQH